MELKQFQSPDGNSLVRDHNEYEKYIDFLTRLHDYISNFNRQDLHPYFLAQDDANAILFLSSQVHNTTIKDNMMINFATAKEICIPLTEQDNEEITGFVHGLLNTFLELTALARK